MAYVITQKCVGTCDYRVRRRLSVRLHRRPGAARTSSARSRIAERGTRFPGIQMFIDPDECIDCGACVAECPVAAIYLDDDVPNEHRGDIERNAAFFRSNRR